ncbi:MAG TPA: ABC transporter substrate-binding protein [Dehalococcoidia bacterium]|nr:ABC transporter substrate-binding protein [Dehalococcoidia bacterium]
MEQGYWSQVAVSRLSRRRAIAATGAGALGAAFLAACGGGDGDEKPKEEVSGLVTKPVDTTKQAKRGGSLKFSVSADIPIFDPHFLSLANAAQVLLNYNRLTRVKPGILQRSDGSIIGDAVESWEFSPDKLTVTMKVRANLGTPQVAPVNGRNLDSSDILYSWERFKKNGNNRSDFVNEVNANAPVLSMSAPDARTIQIKLKNPVSTIMSAFSTQASGQFFIFPKEAEDKVDLRRTPIGAGVYYLSDYVPSSRFVYSRNPNYFDKGVAFADTIEVPIVSENATGLAQLKAGGLFNYAVPVEQVLQTKSDVPDLSLYQTDMALLPGVVVFFGFKAQPADRTPFRDLRVRQAYALSLDRDLFVETFGNISKFTSQGVPIDTAVTSAVSPAVYQGWWLDPKGKDFGPNAQYYQRNIAEAKKLMSAAGHANGLTVASNVADSGYGPNYNRGVEVMEGFASEAGFKFNKVIQGYTTNWPSEFRDSGGFFDGIAYRLQPGASDPGDQLYAEYNKGGSQYYGFDPDGKGLTSKEASTYIGDPTCDDLTNKMKTEFDDAKRKAYAHELQKYLGKMQYKHLSLGAATGFQLAWPAVRNWRVLQGVNDWGQLWASYWLDETQPPLKKA